MKKKIKAITTITLGISMFLALAACDTDGESQLSSLSSDTSSESQSSEHSSSEYSSVEDSSSEYISSESESSEELSSEEESSSEIHVHTPGEAVIENVVEATCTTKGSYDEVIYCTECKAEISRETVSTAALDHEWDEGVITTEPTFDLDGVKTYTCQRDSSHTKTEKVDKLSVKYHITIMNGEHLYDTVRVGETGEYSIDTPDVPGYAFTGFVDEDDNPFPQIGTIDENTTIYIKADVVPTDSAEKLAAAARAGANEIILSESFEIDRPIYFIGNTKVTASKDVTLTRAPTYAGDLFVFGCDEDNRNPLEYGYNSLVYFGDKDGTSGAITIDGNKGNMEVDVVGSIFFMVRGSIAHIYEGVSIINCKKVGNERTQFEYGDVGFTNPSRIGGSAVITSHSSFVMHGGLIQDCEVNTSNPDTDSESPNYLLSTLGGAIYNGGTFEIYSGSIKGCHGYYGGAIYERLLTRIISGSIEDCTAYEGAAVYSGGTRSTDLYIGDAEAETTDIQVLFKNNVASHRGGAIASTIFSPVVCNYAKFLQNGVSSSTGNAGAIYTAGPLVLRNCVFEENYTGYCGGAIYYNYSHEQYTRRCLEASNTVFLNNSAQKGGAITLGSASDITTTGSLGDFVDCRFEGNHAKADTSNGGPGGAVFVNDQSTANFLRCEFVNNVADTQGGAVNVIEQSNVTFEECSFTGNTSVTYGSAITIYGDSAITLTDVDFTDNETQGSGTLYMSGMTLELNNVNFTGNRAQNGGALYANGGSTITANKATFTNNSATNYGGAMYIKETTFTVPEATSENGVEVVFNGNTSPKAGAIFASGGTVLDFQSGSFTNNSATDGGAGAININSTEEQNFENVTFSGNSSTSIGGVFYLIKNSALNLTNCEFTNNTSGTGGALYINGGDEVVIDQCIFTENSTTSTDTDTGYGGAIAMNGVSNLTINDSEFAGNTSAKNGAALGIIDGNLFLTGDNLFSENITATNGGALYMSSCSKLQINEGTVFDGNVATNGEGGAMYITRIRGTDSETGKSTVYFDGVTFINNHSKTSSGVAFIHNSAVDITNCIFGGVDSEEQSLGNYSTGNGGALYITTNSTVYIKDSTFKNNSGANGGAIELYKNTDLTAVGCTFENNVGTTFGGAIYAVDDNDIVLTNCNFTDNKANSSYGGAIYIAPVADKTINFTMNVDLDIDSDATSTVVGSSSNYFGGGIYIGGEGTVFADISDTLFDNNVSARGAAIYSSGSSQNVINVLDSTFTNNTANHKAGEEEGKDKHGTGGAIQISAGELTVNGCSFTNNESNGVSSTDTAIGSGGAIYVSGTGTTANVLDSTFTNNTATSGGAISVSGVSNLYITDSKFIANTTTKNGGAITISNGNLFLNGDNLFIENIAGTNGGAIYLSNSSNLQVNEGSIFDGNAATNGSGGAIYMTRTRGTDPETEKNTVYLDGATFVNNNSKSYGGALYVHNSAIDINNSTFGGFDDDEQPIGNNTNGDGGAIYMVQMSVVNVNNSSFLNNDATDGGAIMLSNGYELNVVNSTFKYNSASTGNGGAISAFYTQNEHGAVVNISNNTTDNEDAITLFEGNTAYLNGGAVYLGSQVTANISGTEFKNNTATSEETDNKGHGGALSTISSTSLTISNTTFDGNSTLSGGALYVTETPVNIGDNTSFINNSANTAGAAMFDTCSDIVISGENIIFEGNSSTSSTGGALYFEKARPGEDKQILINGVTFTNNTGKTSGGAIYVHNSDITVRNSTFTENTVPTNGSAAYVSSNSSISIYDSVIQNNQAKYGAIALYTNADLTAVGCTFEGNVGTTYGGAIYAISDNEIVLTNCNFVNNRANSNYGGAIYVAPAADKTANFTMNVDLDINPDATSSVVGSTSTYFGAGIYFGGDGNVNANISDTLFSNNVTASGGAIYSTGANNVVTVNNSTFTNNVANHKAGSEENADKHGKGGAIFVTAGELTVNNSTFTNNESNGVNTGDATVGSGGAIYASDSATLTLSSSTFTANSATTGGAVSVSASSATVTNSTFTGNTTTGNNSDNDVLGAGGAIVLLNGATAEVSSSAFTSNEGLRGGSIAAMLSDATINDCDFNQNSAGRAAGVFVRGTSGTDKAEVSIVNSRFIENTATANGGAVLIDKFADVTISDNTIFQANASGSGSRGGAIYMSTNASNLDVSDSSFINNVSVKDGGAVAIQCNASDVTFTNVTFSGNTATTNGGTVYITHGATVTFDGCVVENNSCSSYGGFIYAGDYASTINIKTITASGNTAASATKGNFVHGAAKVTVNTNKDYISYNGAAAGATELSTIIKGTCTVNVVPIED